MTSPKIVLAADHAGYKLKESVKSFLQEKKYDVLDVGAHEYNEQDDYPPFIAAAAMKVAEDGKGNTRAIIFGGSGQGEAMVANRFPGVRATVWYGEMVVNTDASIIKLSRTHNDANILSIGARFVTAEDAKQAVELWLNTGFSHEDRHSRRIAQIDAIE